MANPLDKVLSERINRTVEIETILFDMAAGKLALPTAQDCRVLAIRLGSPKKEWSDDIRNHEFKFKE